MTLFLFSSAYADERMSKDNLLKQWEGSVVSMTGLYDKPISFKVSNGELTYIKNSNSSATDAWIRDNGKLCIEYRHQDDCHRVIKTSEGVFTVKGLASTQSFRKGTSATYKKRILTLSSEVREVPSEQITFKNTIAYENGKDIKNSTFDKLEYRDGIAYAVGEINTFTGVHLAKHSNGKRKFKVSYTNGLKHGLSTSWHYNGKRKSEVIYRNNKKEGVEARWHYEGQKSEETNYTNDNKSGLSTEWHENGQRYRETNFMNEQGRRTQWNSRGQKMWSGYINVRGRVSCCIDGCDIFNNPIPICQ